MDLELGRCRLPVSRRVLALRQPSGADDLLLVEAARSPRGDAVLACALATRLARAVEGDTPDWGNLSVTDLDAFVLRLRQALIGDRIRADLACPAAGCHRRIDIDFSVEAFLAHHAPQEPAALEAAAEPGWFNLAGERSAGDPDSRPICFRLPTVRDQLAVMDRPDATEELARRCIRPADLPAQSRAHVEAVMEELAPSLSGELQGVCPECSTTVAVQFDARWFCLRELRERAAFLYQDVDILARRYHWSEGEILALPNVRRAAYVELARQAVEV
jgi:hypothetical protein